MKYPEYINEKLIKKTKELFNYIKQTQGTKEAFIFKKLSLVAAYGQMYVSKISYREFLNDFEEYLFHEENIWRKKSLQKFGCAEPLVSKYWGIVDLKGTAFWVSHEHIANDNIEQLEKAIIEQLKRAYGMVGHEVYTKYNKYCNEVIEEYETRRSKQTHRTL